MALPAILMVEGEEPFHGFGLGYEGVASGVLAVSAVAFGFPDLLTDPSYDGKLVSFSYPHVGNAGVVPEDLQGEGVAARGMVAREICKFAANRLGVESIGDFLTRNRVPAMEGADTRTIAQIAAKRGMVRAVLGVGKYADAGALAERFAHAGDFAPGRTGTAAPYHWKGADVTDKHFKVVVYDFGVKQGFLRRLAAGGCSSMVVPSDFPVEAALAENPDGIVFSAGAGTPESRLEALPAAKALLGKKPLWGIGVGAGVLAVAAGAKAVVDGHGHTGVHPVGRLGGPIGSMTVQRHDFWLDEASLAAAGLDMTHRHLNDRSVEGFACDTRRLMGVLFHPESEPGPRDSLYLFDRFHEMMRK